MVPYMLAVHTTSAPSDASDGVQYPNAFEVPFTPRFCVVRFSESAGNFKLTPILFMNIMTKCIGTPEVVL